MAYNSSTVKVSTAATAAALRKPKASAARKRRRTKGPSQKIRSMAAMGLAQKVGYLKLSDLIGHSNWDLEKFIDERLPKRVFKKGDTVYPSRTADPVLFLIRSGSVNVYRPSTTGTKFYVKRIGPGIIFGEMPLLGQSMLGAHVEADERTEAVLINASGFETLCGASQALPANALRVLGPRLCDAERRHEQAAFQPVTSRIASLLLRLANANNQVMGYTHQDMADTLGVYRETVTNALAELKQDKLIKIGRKRIELADVQGLRKLESF